MIAALPLLLRLAWPGALFSHLFAMPWYGGLLREWATDGLQAGDQVLELGCAGGELAAELSRMGARVTAVERMAITARAARRRAPQASVLHGDALTTPTPLAAFDRVLAASLLNLVPDPVALLARMHEHLRPGGTLQVLVPDAGFDDAALQRLRGQLRLRGTEDAALRLWHRAAPKMHAAALRAHCEAAGLSSVRLQPRLGGLLLDLRSARCRTAPASSSARPTARSACR